MLFVFSCFRGRSYRRVRPDYSGASCDTKGCEAPVAVASIERYTSSTFTDVGFSGGGAFVGTTLSYAAHQALTRGLTSATFDQRGKTARTRPVRAHAGADHQWTK